MRPDLATLHGYHSPQVDVAVRLNTNESPEPPPPGWWEEFRAELSDLDWNRYPDRDALHLRRAIGEGYGAGSSQVLVANGSNECLQALCLTYGGAGRTVAVFEPTYRLHSHIARITGTSVVEGTRQEDFRLDLAEVDRVIAQANPELVFLCSPNNPSGMLEPEFVVREVLDRCRRAGALLVVDEAYGQFAPWSATSLIAENAPLVVSRTFSKTWSMAAARLGYLLGPQRVIAEIETVLLPYHLDAVKQIAGRIAVRYRSEMEERVARLVEQRGRVAQALSELPVQVWPSAANFILFRPTRREGGAVWSDLLDRGVLVRDCSSWPGLDGALRVTIGSGPENDRFISALTEVLT